MLREVGGVGFKAFKVRLEPPIAGSVRDELV